ncbi:MAG: AraC family transcriptional regulator [Sphingobacteriia bacterium]|nr:MAG: AraC family transcriptional regulator [Sphingobacteriia bacterium]
MVLKDFAPALALREWVQLYRIVHLEFGVGDLVPFKAYPPRPEQCLAFYPYDTETVQYSEGGRTEKNLPVVVYGQFTQVTQRHIGRRFLVFQVIFQPGALYRLTGIPATALQNQYLDAAMVFGPGLDQMNEQLFHCADYAAMVAVADGFLPQLVRKVQKPASPLDLFMSQWLYQPDAISLDQMAKQLFMGTKTIERKSYERTGVSPKQFLQIIRFDQAFRLRNAHPEMDWLRIAIETGFYDYQHLSKVYQQFTGMRPVAFHALEEKAPERKFGLSENYYQSAM